jgi:6-phosphogluconolactonase
MQVREQRCAGGPELALLLARGIAADLAAAIALRGHATLAVSGGKSPVAMFEALRHCDIDWRKVTISLVDERLVPHDHADSNTGLVRQHLMHSRAASAKLLPLFDAVPDDLPKALDALALDANQRTEALGKAIDVVVLGMGEDGHTASLFGGAANIAHALRTPERFAWTDPKPGPGVAPYPRLTLGLKAIAGARHIHLSIAGESKRSVLNAARAQIATDQAVIDGKAFPIGLVLQQAQQPINVWTA